MALTREQIARTLRSFERLFVVPDVPGKKLATAQRVHADSLTSDDPILALYDDTAFGGSREGFLLTERRICWKNLFDSPQSTLYAALDPDEVRVDGAAVRLSEDDSIDVTTTPEIAAPLAALLRAAVGGPAAARPPEPALTAATGTADLIRKLVSARLGGMDGLYVGAAIPSKKLQRARAAHGAVLDNAEVIVLYDDTLFGTGEDGFVLTAQHLAWKNLMSSPSALQWSDISPDGIAPAGGGVSLAGGEISIAGKEALLPTLAEVFQAIARAARALPATPRAGRCTYCSVRVDAGDPRCPGCGAPL